MSRPATERGAPVSGLRGGDTKPASPEELKRLEKLYDITKELFNYSENIIKSLEEKSRSNATVVSAITAFAFLIRKPDELAGNSRYIIYGVALLLFSVYALHFLIVRPQKSGALRPAELSLVEEQVKQPEGVVFYSYSGLSQMYARNLELIQRKGQLVMGQTALLGLTLLTALIYLASNTAPAGHVAAPTQVTPSTVTAPAGNVPLKRPSNTHPIQRGTP